MIIVCEECNKEFTLPDHTRNEARRFCNRQCSNQGMRTIKDPLQWFIREKLTRVRSNAQKRDIPFDLKWEDVYNLYIKQNGKCYYSNIKLSLKFADPDYKLCPPTLLSIDRLDNHRGYTIDNIVLCCYMVNAFKGEYSTEILKEFINMLYNKPLSVNIKKLIPEAKIPSYSKIGDAAMDLTATSKIQEGKNIVYGTGLAIEIPEGYVGLLFPRSSLTNYDLSLGNHVGVVDSGYRGEILFKFKRTDLQMLSKEYQIWDRIGQLLIIPYPKVELVEVAELNTSERGKTGYGSSGK